MWSEGFCPSQRGSSLWQVMGWWWRLLLGLWAVPPTCTGRELLNVCMNAKPHKPEPSPEAELYEEVWRPALVWGSGEMGTALVDQGRDTKAKRVSEPLSIWNHLVP